MEKLVLLMFLVLNTLGFAQTETHIYKMERGVLTTVEKDHGGVFHHYVNTRNCRYVDPNGTLIFETLDPTTEGDNTAASISVSTSHIKFQFDLDTDDPIYRTNWTVVEWTFRDRFTWVDMSSPPQQVFDLLSGSSYGYVASSASFEATMPTAGLNGDNYVLHAVVEFSSTTPARDFYYDSGSGQYIARVILSVDPNMIRE